MDTSADRFETFEEFMSHFEPRHEWLPGGDYYGFDICAKCGACSDDLNPVLDDPACGIGCEAQPEGNPPFYGGWVALTPHEQWEHLSRIESMMRSGEDVRTDASHDEYKAENEPWRKAAGYVSKHEFDEYGVCLGCGVLRLDIIGASWGWLRIGCDSPHESNPPAYSGQWLTPTRGAGMTAAQRGVQAAEMAIHALDIAHTLDWLDDDEYEHTDYGADPKAALDSARARLAKFQALIEAERDTIHSAA
jgi:hypothetical protein